MTHDITYIKNETGETRIQFFDTIPGYPRKVLDISKKVGMFYIHGSIVYKSESKNDIDFGKFTMFVAGKMCNFTDKNLDGNPLNAIANLDDKEVHTLVTKLAKKDEKAKEVLEKANIANYNFSHKPSLLDRIYDAYQQRLRD